MKNRQIPAICLVLVLAAVQSAVAMEISLLVQGPDSGPALAGCPVQLVFNPGTAAAETIIGYTDDSGILQISHDLVSVVAEIPPLVISRPYPNPAGATVAFGVTGGDKANHALLFSLYDLRGRRVGYGNVEAGGVELTRPLGSGSYLYRVTEGPEVKTVGKLTVQGRLERVAFTIGSEPRHQKYAADPVEILIQLSGWEEYSDFMVLTEGQHFLSVSLNPNSACGNCELFLSIIRDLIAAAGATTYSTIRDVVSIGCENIDYPELADSCRTTVYPQTLNITDMFYEHEPPRFICAAIGMCSSFLSKPVTFR